MFALRWFVRRILYPTALALAITLVYVPVNGANASVEMLRLRLEPIREQEELRVGGVRIAARTLIPAFYERRGWRLAWDDPVRVRALRDAVEASATHGLNPADYHAAVLPELLDAPASEAQRADRDIVLTDALIRLAYHLRFGKANPRELYPQWNFSRSLGGVEPVTVLEAMFAEPRLDRAIERFAPQLADYAQLREALSRLRAVEARGGWPRLAMGPSLKPGTSDARVPALRARLEAGGELAAQRAADALRFDEPLETAVRAFQARHGLAADGVVGRQTLEALNVSVGARIELVRVNLERLRWVAQDLTGDYLVVDVAGFEARLFLGGRRVWESRTVVGRPYRKTPVFRADLRYLVLNPTWNVPPTILREDVLPKAARDPGYLARNHMRVVDAAGRAVDPRAIDWPRTRGARFPYQIVQDPGDDNALGRIKFMLPNPHAVYLHDTPSRALFERATRAFSSGCIRLERPLELAIALLDDADRWNLDTLREAIATGETRSVSLRRQVPALVLYFTATADAGGEPRFHPDLYGRDARVAAALAAPFRFAPVDGARRLTRSPRK